MSKILLKAIIITFAAMVVGCGSSENDDIGQGANSQAIKLLPPDNSEIYFGAFPDFGGDEEHVTKESIHTLHNEGVVPLVRMQPRSSTTEYVRETEYTLEKIINGAFDRELIQWAKDAKIDNIPILIGFGVAKEIGDVREILTNGPEIGYECNYAS